MVVLRSAAALVWVWGGRGGEAMCLIINYATETTQTLISVCMQSGVRTAINGCKLSLLGHHYSRGVHMSKEFVHISSWASRQCPQ